MVENNYELFSEAQNEMKEHLLLKCSVCGNLNPIYINKKFPKEVEEFIYENEYLNEDAIIEAAGHEYIAVFQDVEIQNFENEVPSFLCEICIKE